MNAMWPARYEVRDEDDRAIRKFWTLAEARAWMCGREEMRLVKVVVPTRQEVRRRMFDGADEAVF